MKKPQDHLPPAVEQPKHAFSTEEVAVHVDGATQTVTFAQRRNKLAIKPDEVTVPFLLVSTLFCSLLQQQLAAAGVQVNAGVPHVGAPGLHKVQ